MLSIADMRRGVSPFGLSTEDALQVGAPDPALDLELEAGACARSGSDLLECSGGGVWVRSDD